MLLGCFSDSAGLKILPIWDPKPIAINLAEGIAGIGSSCLGLPGADVRRLGDQLLLPFAVGLARVFPLPFSAAVGGPSAYHRSRCTGAGECVVAGEA